MGTLKKNLELFVYIIIYLCPFIMYYLYYYLYYIYYWYIVDHIIYIRVDFPRINDI